jgi:hypothetical protein
MRAAGAASQISTGIPLARNAIAAVNPPIPAPTINTLGRLIAAPH